MNLHKWYVGQFFNWRQGQTNVFAVTYCDQIPICPRKTVLLWATSPTMAKKVYELMRVDIQREVK